MTDQEIAQDYAKRLEDIIREFKPNAIFSWRRMFGGAGYYVDEQIFAAWFGRDELALKLPEDEAERLKKLGGIAAPEGMSKQYTHLALAIQNDEKELAVWVEKSVNHVETLPKKKKKQ